MDVFLIMKWNEYHNIYKNFQVHSSITFGLGAKTNIARRKQPSSTPNFDSLPYPYSKVGWWIIFAKMTAKDDPTISSSHLVAGKQKQAF